MERKRHEPTFAPKLWEAPLRRAIDPRATVFERLIHAEPRASLTRRQRITILARRIAGRVRDAFLVLIGKREVI